MSDKFKGARRHARGEPSTNFFTNTRINGSIKQNFLATGIAGYGFVYSRSIRGWLPVSMPCDGLF